MFIETTRLKIKNGDIWKKIWQVIEKESGKTVGCFYLNPAKGKTEYLVMGATIEPGCHAREYFCEAACEITNWILENKKAQAVIVYAEPEDEELKTELKKIGFSDIGKKEEYIVFRKSDYETKINDFINFIIAGMVFGFLAGLVILGSISIGICIGMSIGMFLGLLKDYRKR